MTRGTTLPNIFDIDLDLSEALAVYVTYTQKGQTVLEKSLEDIIIEGTQITVPLSQTDTLAFDSDYPVEIQIGYRLPDNTTDRSDIILTSVGRVLKDEVI